MIDVDTFLIHLDMADSYGEAQARKDVISKDDDVVNEEMEVVNKLYPAIVAE